MKILVLCDHGNNRSITIAGRLKYADTNNDVLSAGLVTNSHETIVMLAHWADRIILTAKNQYDNLDPAFHDKVQLWDIGPDVYPRPLHPGLLQKVKQWEQIWYE